MFYDLQVVQRKMVEAFGALRKLHGPYDAACGGRPMSFRFTRHVPN